MKYCPNCKSEFTDEAEICNDCGIKLADYVEEVKDEIPDEDLELLYTTDEPYKAQMLISNLESAGIGSWMLSQKDTSFSAVGNLSVVKVFVKKEDFEAASEFIESLNTQDNNELNYEE